MKPDLKLAGTAGWRGIGWRHTPVSSSVTRHIHKVTRGEAATDNGTEVFLARWGGWPLGALESWQGRVNVFGKSGKRSTW